MKKLCIVIFLLLPISVSAQAVDSLNLPPGDSPRPTPFSRIKNAGTADDFDSAAYAIVLDSSCTRIDEKGVAKTDSYLLYKMLTDEGCREMSVLNWRYEPLSSYVDIREVNIIRGDKAINVPMAQVLDLPAPQSGIYWSDRVKMLQLPRLHPGDGVEVKTYRKGYSYALLDNDKSEPADDRYVPPMAGEYFDIVVFEATEPIVEKIYVLNLPADKRIHSQVYNGPLYSSTTYNADTTTYAWWIINVPAWETQRYRPDRTDILTKVVIATVKDWETKSRWFFEVNEPQFAYTPAIKAKVDEIFARAGVTNGTEAQKAFELVHWVAQNIRYSGQTMGEGEGYTLHPGAMIFEQRSGVCKDIAGMLITMMRAAGMDSYAAMTMAGSHIETVPADQFNHCVVALRKDDGRYVMYDPTWVPFNEDIWSKYETEQDYLIGSPEGNGLSRIPYSPPEESPLNIDNKGTILKDGTLEGTLNLSARGAIDGRLRGYLYWYKLSQNLNNMASIIGKAANQVEIIEIEHGDIYDFHKSMWWKITYRIPQYAVFIDGTYEFKSPMMLMTSQSLYRYISFEWPEKRRDDVFFYNTTFVNAHEEIKLPGGYKVNEPVAPDEVDETYAHFKGSGETQKGQLVIDYDLKIKRRQIPQKGYEGFRKVMKETDDFAKTEFRAEKGGAK